MRTRLTAIGIRGFALAGSFIQVVVISRTLTLDDAGLVFLLFTLMNLAATLGRFGTDNLILRRIASLPDAEDPEAYLLRMVCWIVSCVAGTALTICLASGMLSILGAQMGLLESICVGLMTVFYSFNVFAGAVLRASGRMVSGILAELGTTPWLSILLVGAQAMFVKSSVLTVLCSLLAAAFATSFWAYRATRTIIHVPGRAEWGQGLVFVRCQLSSLASLMGTSLLFFVLVWVPQLGLGLVGTGTQVAQYTAAAKVAALINIFPGMQTSYLAPKLAELAHARQVKELSRECGGAALVASLVAVPLLTLVAFQSTSVLRIFGEGYQEAATPALILCAGAYATLAFGQVNTVMLTAGLERPALLLNSVLLLLVAVVTVAGAPALGVSGIAAASALASLGYAAISSFIIRLRLGVNSTIGSFLGPLFFTKRNAEIAARHAS
ncbi:O-antigen/teichoic acid export membrane protein [Arthrobacter sp. B2I5]|uniref:lipopolysaccharide biosynthesis protein n=1 Tax=Arthrobacter sp. B2I5 TaxID=3042266 RepID=UPI002782EA67|nr:oligosaccharide flippase family protein [Arthrobacter sp. B2I5]MDQ0824665.1 O-antigen/teichoic acid export membrane protein [Arthrobacter sp. B2I5]